MIVNDHTAFRQALAVMLEHRGGFDVCAEVGSSAEAKRTLSALTARPDLVILDLDPRDRITEYLVRELVRELCDGPSATGVMILTADGNLAGTPEKVRVLGTDVSADEILSVARQLVG